MPIARISNTGISTTSFATFFRLVSAKRKWDILVLDAREVFFSFSFFLCFFSLFHFSCGKPSETRHTTRLHIYRKRKRRRWSRDCVRWNGPIEWDANMNRNYITMTRSFCMIVWCVLSHEHTHSYAVSRLSLCLFRHFVESTMMHGIHF